MSKELYAELKEAFENLKKSEAEKIYDAIENREFLPIPFTLPIVLETIQKVLENHKVTNEELINALLLNTNTFLKQTFSL